MYSSKDDLIENTSITKIKNILFINFDTGNESNFGSMFDLLNTGIGRGTRLTDNENSILKFQNTLPKSIDGNIMTLTDNTNNCMYIYIKSDYRTDMNKIFNDIEINKVILCGIRCEICGSILSGLNGSRKYYLHGYVEEKSITLGKCASSSNSTIIFS
jgi:hypothetical protein